jgi:hypothetical protein
MWEGGAYDVVLWLNSDFYNYVLILMAYPSFLGGARG